MNLAAYGQFVAPASVIGLRILIAAGGVLVADIVALATYVIRNGERDEPEEQVTTVDRPMTPVFFNSTSCGTRGGIIRKPNERSRPEKRLD